METIDQIWEKLQKSGYKVSTDTRKDVSGTVFFGIKGDNFDGTLFAKEAQEKGALVAVTDNALHVLQTLARRYRETLNIPIIAIGGSNGKTTTRELTRTALKTRYKVYATEENLNNHIGLPLSIFSLDKSAEIAIFEIGANHPEEHLKLLEILRPTHVFVTNDGLDHLEGFGSEEGVRAANQEIRDWAVKNNVQIIVRSEHAKQITHSLFLTIEFNSRTYETKLVGAYNLENINSALSIGETFEVDIEKGLEAIARYEPNLKRSQLVSKDGVQFILDCYNANPTSMRLALESFSHSPATYKGVILGDMLELGNSTNKYHKEILELIATQKLDLIVLVGENFSTALKNSPLKKAFCFLDWKSAQDWFDKENLEGWTILIKGSHGIKLDKILD